MASLHGRPKMPPRWRHSHPSTLASARRLFRLANRIRPSSKGSGRKPKHDGDKSESGVRLKHGGGNKRLSGADVQNAHASERHGRNVAKRHDGNESRNVLPRLKSGVWLNAESALGNNVRRAHDGPLNVGERELKLVLKREPSGQGSDVPTRVVAGAIVKALRDKHVQVNAVNVPPQLVP
ncbi:MAG: hypothetical protein AAFR70_09600 [Pseudomonadota bacterium]